MSFTRKDQLHRDFIRQVDLKPDGYFELGDWALKPDQVDMPPGKEKLRVHLTYSPRQDTVRFRLIDEEGNCRLAGHITDVLPEQAVETLDSLQAL